MDILCIVPALPFSGVSSVGNLHLSYTPYYYLESEYRIYPDHS